MSLVDKLVLNLNDNKVYTVVKDRYENCEIELLCQGNPRNLGTKWINKNSLNLLIPTPIKETL